jgi:hypothetical protein
MSNEVIPFDSTGKDVPAHLVAAFGDDNIGPRVTINQLSYRGNKFRRVVDGEETLITEDRDGEKLPRAVINLVVLDHNKSRSRAFYEGNYEEGKNTAPKCYSGDGIKPDVSVKEPCAATCAACPNSVKGSKTTPTGAATTACSPFKRIAIVPSASLLSPNGHVPLLLRLAQTSVWDKDNKHEAQGWYAWDQYLDMLRAKGVKHTGAIETRVKFDPDVAYPKLLFSASRWMNVDEAVAIKAKLAADAEVIAGIINGAGNADGTMGQPAAPAPATPTVDPAAAAAHAAQAAAAAQAAQAAQEAAARQAAADAAAREAAERERKMAELRAQMEALQGGTAAAAAPAATATVATKAAAVDDGFGGGSAAPAPSPSPAPAAAAAQTGASTPVIESGTPASLSGLLADWDK